MQRLRWILGLLSTTSLLGCGPHPSNVEDRGDSIPTAPPTPVFGLKEVKLTILATNDLHGRVNTLPVLAGHVSIVRDGYERRQDGGVLVVDGGDMFQGTLESNLLEGAPVRDAYAAIGYGAVTIGNHEFDYGPIGPQTVVTAPSDHPRGALFELSRSAPFPFLAANLSEQGGPLKGPNVKPTHMVEVAGIDVGIVGITTAETLRTTLAPNVADLSVLPLLETTIEQASRLRREGAEVIVVLAHAGGRCRAFTGDPIADGCDDDSEVFTLARALPKGSVDVIVAGHTHAGIAHEINGIVILEQFAYGRAFGRVDLTMRGRTIAERKIFAPQNLCLEGADKDPLSCAIAPYEGSKVTRGELAREAIVTGQALAQQRKKAPLGPKLLSPIKAAYGTESALGNLFADLLRTGDVDVALMNGGGLRADLPAGELTFGALFEAFPFDNRMAEFSLRVDELAAILRNNAERDQGILSVSGVVVETRCKGSELEVTLRRPGSKKPLPKETELKVVTSDFLVLGGDSFWGPLEPKPYRIDAELMRDVMVRELASRKTLSESELLNPRAPRQVYEGKRPLRCGVREATHP